MRIALLVPDNRENFRRYELPEPYFGTAPTGLLEGFAMLQAEGETSASRMKDSDFEIHVISCTQQKMPAPEKIAPNIWFHSLHVPKLGWLRSGYLGCTLAVRKKLREIKPDIIHAQGTERDCAVSAVLSHYPKILTIHGNLRLIKRQVGFRPFSAMWFQTFLEALVVPQFDGIICITNYTLKAVEHEVPRTWVVPNAVDPSFLALGEERVKKQESKKVENPDNASDFDSKPSDLFTFPPSTPIPIILCVANIDARKNQNVLIKALDFTAERMPFELRLFGKCDEGEYGLEFEELIAARPWCSYGGMIGREELRSEFGKSSMLVLPTHEDNCPMVILEAQAAGVPVIASNVGGIPDLVEDEISGLMIDPNRAESISGAVERLLQDSTLCERLAGVAYLRALERFHPIIIATRHLEIYQEMLSKRKA